MLSDRVADLLGTLAAGAGFGIWDALSGRRKAA